jgi:hypothetical protein
MGVDNIGERPYTRPMNETAIIFTARQLADDTATDDNWQDVVDTEIERLSAIHGFDADEVIETANLMRFRAAGII